MKYLPSAGCTCTSVMLYEDWPAGRQAESIKIICIIHHSSVITRCVLKLKSCARTEPNISISSWDACASERDRQPENENSCVRLCVTNWKTILEFRSVSRLRTKTIRDYVQLLSSLVRHSSSPQPHTPFDVETAENRWKYFTRAHIAHILKTLEAGTAAVLVLYIGSLKMFFLFSRDKITCEAISCEMNAQQQLKFHFHFYGVSASNAGVLYGLFPSFS